jgi:hypothetical protein
MSRSVLIYIICSFSSLVHDKSKGSLHFFLQKDAASCVWLASKLEENTRKARQVLIIFHRMECRRENLPIDHLDLYSKVGKLPFFPFKFCSAHTDILMDLDPNDESL